MIIKRLILLTLTLLMLMVSPALAHAAVNENLIDETHIFLENDAIKKGDTTYLPMDKVLKPLGVTVHYGKGHEDKILLVDKNKRYQIEVYPGENPYAVIEDQERPIDIMIKGEQVYFPLKVYLEIVDREMKWNDQLTLLTAIDKVPTLSGDEESGYVNLKPVLKTLPDYNTVTVSRGEDPKKDEVRETEATVEPTKEPTVIIVDNGKLFWPTTATRVSSPFGNRRGGFHTGIDIDGDSNDPIFAASDGTVIKAGWNGGYGYCIDVQHSNGMITRYAHLNKISVNKGAQVKRGQTIGLQGSTGNSTGSHLHFETIISGKQKNPMGYLK